MEPVTASEYIAGVTIEIGMQRSSLYVLTRKCNTDNSTIDLKEVHSRNERKNKISALRWENKGGLT